MAGLALLYDDSTDIQLRIGPLLAACSPSLYLVVVDSADAVREYVDSGRATVLLAGAAPDLVTAATTALLSCDRMVPLIRLLKSHDLAPPAATACVRLDGTLSVASLTAALRKAARLLSEPTGEEVRRS